MKIIFVRRLIPLLVLPIAAVFQLPAQTNSSDITPASVLNAMQKVADWQLAHPVMERPTGWICGVGDIGMMAMAGISGDPKYRDAMLAKGGTNGWQLPSYQGRKYHADDQCIGQVWAELYFLYRENRMIEPMRAKMDFILANPPAEQSLDWLQGKHQDTWSWCDALFMAPPAWLRLYAATDDERYMNYAVSNFWHTSDFLYDKEEHLYFRDSSFFDKREANGQKVFGVAAMAGSLPELSASSSICHRIASSVRALNNCLRTWRKKFLPASNPMECGAQAFSVPTTIPCRKPVALHCLVMAWRGG